MSTMIGVVAETRPDEHRTALVPDAVASLVAAQFQILVETNSGRAAGFSDADFAKAGAEIVETDELYRRSHVITCVNAVRRSARLHRGQFMVGMLQPWRHPMLIEHWARRDVTMISLDRAPRLPQAHGINPTATQARIAGRQAVLLAEEHFGGRFPTIASDGALRPARVLVFGAGVVGLQAMSSARLLGADVTGYTGRADGRAAVTSRGARFLEVGTALVGDDDSDQQRLARRHELDTRIGEFDAVITAVGTPGRRPPRLVTATAIAGMRPGSVIIDIAASRYGGNVIGSRPGTTLTVPPGVRLIGADNLPSQAPAVASDYYADNMVVALRRLCATGEPRADLADPVWSAMVLGHQGWSVHREPRNDRQPRQPTKRSVITSPITATTPANSIAARGLPKFGVHPRPNRRGTHNA